MYARPVTDVFLEEIKVKHSTWIERWACCSVQADGELFHGRIKVSQHFFTNFTAFCLFIPSFPRVYKIISSAWFSIMWKSLKIISFSPLLLLHQAWQLRHVNSFACCWKAKISFFFLLLLLLFFFFSLFDFVFLPGVQSVVNAHFALFLRCKFIY